MKAGMCVKGEEKERRATEAFLKAPFKLTARAKRKEHCNQQPIRARVVI